MGDGRTDVTDGSDTWVTEAAETVVTHSEATVETVEDCAEVEEVVGLSVDTVEVDNESNLANSASIVVLKLSLEGTLRTVLNEAVVEDLLEVTVFFSFSSVGFSWDVSFIDSAVLLALAVLSFFCALLFAFLDTGALSFLLVEVLESFLGFSSSLEGFDFAKSDLPLVLVGGALSESDFSSAD